MTEIYRPDGSADFEKAVEKFSDQEVATPEEAKEYIQSHPELKKDLEDGLNEAAQKNKNNPSALKVIGYIGATGGLTIAVLSGARYVQENQQLAPDYKPNETSETMTPEAKAMQERDMQYEAEAFHKEQTAIEADLEKEIYVAEPPSDPNEIKNTPMPD